MRTAAVKGVRSALSWDGTVAGRGDDVLIYLGDTAAAADVEYSGDSEFAVASHPMGTAGEGEVLVDEIGPYSGSVRFPGSR